MVAYRAFNARLALLLTRSVSTMECAYVFAALAILGFPGFAATAQQYVQWVSQTCIQLVMLSVIMVGQDLMSKQHDAHHAEQMAHHQAHAARLDAIEQRLAQKPQRSANGRFTKE